jgi:thiol-disulfide isomerase/thioredoxin
MTKTIKRTLIEYGVMATVLLALFLTGLHTEVFGFLQRGVLATGIMKPDVGKEIHSVQNEGDMEADFNMKLINSKGERLSLEQFRGKVIFINIWATWCPPCIAEMPGINDLFNELDDPEIVFLMLSVDQDFEKAIRFKKKKEFDFEVYKVDGGIPQMYYTESIPTTFVIDANGELALTHAGMADYNTAEFKQFLQSLK